VKTVFDIPLGQALTTIGVDQLYVFGPEVTDDLSRILLVSRANLEFYSVCAHLAAREAAHRDDHVGVTRRRCVWCETGLSGG
jgi:hypothetical protein